MRLFKVLFLPYSSTDSPVPSLELVSLDPSDKCVRLLPPPSFEADVGALLLPDAYRAVLSPVLREEVEDPGPLWLSDLVLQPSLLAMPLKLSPPLLLRLSSWLPLPVELLRESVSLDVGMAMKVE